MKKNLKITCLLILICAVGKAQNYTFNQKISFSIEAEGQSYNTYIYLNTQNGNAGQDKNAFKDAGDTEGMIFFLFEPNKKNTVFAEVEGKKIKYTLPNKPDNYTIGQFWKDFKKTGKRQTFGKYNAEEYTGDTSEGKISIWLSNTTRTLGPNSKKDMLGVLGMGYLYQPSLKSYFLIVRLQSNEEVMTLQNIQNVNFTFNASGYTNQAMPTIPKPNTSTEEKPSPENPTENYYPNPSQAYGTQNAKCALYYEQAIMVIEQSLPALKELLKNEQISAEQKTELRKQIACMEKKLPILKKMLSEAKAVDSRFKGNEQKLMEECQKIGDKYNDTLDKMCE